MLKDNLAMLRNIHGYSQEEIAEKIGISRQAYAKWENGQTIPDIEKCSLLASEYGVSIDSLIKPSKVEGVGIVPPAPEGKNIWGSIIMNDRGQIVIPKAARERYGLESGSRLIVLGDEEGIALVPAETFEENMKKIREFAYMKND